ncbi:hypothetical protein [Rhizorhabdus argentea]|uniref:hypothetical protein n=1 Tax=Rhizorhabdus argentea TaxID=1387174 RepID=UPI0030EEF69E
MRLTFKTEEERQAFIVRSREQDACVRAGKMRMAYGFAAWLDDNELGRDFIRDTRLLPYPKRNLYYALLHAIANTPSQPVVDAFTACLLVLPHYQDSIGKAVTMPDLEERDLPGLTPVEAYMHFADFDFDKFKAHRDAVYRDRDDCASMSARAKAANVRLVTGHRKMWQMLRRQGQFASYYKGYTFFPNPQPGWKLEDFPTEG